MISIAEAFTKFPAGRYRTDGPYSGQRFREDLLAPALRANDRVLIKLDGTMGYGSSFLEEVFGGLARSGEFDGQSLDSRIELESRDASLISEIHDYLLQRHH